MATAYIGLGSNVGDRKKNLLEALDYLRDSVGVEILETSSFYETEPVGYIDQRDFLNAAVAIETSLNASELLALTKSIEQIMARRREKRWGPRNIDLDILLYEDKSVEEQDLRVPHPRMFRRAFVLVPLAEIASDFRVPGGKTVAKLLEELGEVKGVRLWGEEENRLS